MIKASAITTNNAMVTMQDKKGGLFRLIEGIRGAFSGAAENDTLHHNAYEMTIYNNPATYGRLRGEALVMPTPTVSAFAIHEDEVIEHTYSRFNATAYESLCECLDPVDIAIVEEIARSRFLNSLQVYEFIRLRGFDLPRTALRAHITRLHNSRMIHESVLKAPGVVNGLRYYEIDFNGYRLAREKGVAFNAGNRYLSYNKKVEMNQVDTPESVKRVLAANQILLGLLISGARMERFGIMETYAVDPDWATDKPCVMRVTAVAQIDAQSILAYEVVRDTKEAYAALADKVSRYINILHSKQYLRHNNHGDTAYPQLVICGESLAHNRKIAAYLRGMNLLNDEDTILFTEDLLGLSGSLQTIYEFTADGDRHWYTIPSKDAAERRIA